MLNLLRIKKILKTSLHNFAIVDFKLPDLGEKIKEAEVKKWLVKEGDLVSEF